MLVPSANVIAPCPGAVVSARRQEASAGPECRILTGASESLRPSSVPLHLPLASYEYVAGAGMLVAGGSNVTSPCTEHEPAKLCAPLAGPITCLRYAPRAMRTAANAE